MTKFFTLFTTLTAIVLFGACGEKTAPLFTATAEGVNPVLLGANVDALPASAEKLYDAFTIENISDDFDGDYTIIHFTLNNTPVIDAYPYDGKISSIEILSSEIGSPEGIHPGSKVSELLKKGGMATMRNDGALYLRIGDINFTVSGLKEAGMMKIENSYAQGTDPLIQADDFERDALVEQIVIF